MSNTHTLTVKLPYPLRHLLAEIKSRGGRFDAQSKSWNLPDNADNRLLAERLAVEHPKPSADPEERIKAVTTVAAELLNALQLGHFVVCETSSTRVVIEKISAA